MPDFSYFTQRPHQETDQLNYRICVSELLRWLRGEMSQRDLSLKMGFTFNQVGKWESGVTQIKWDDFFVLCECLNIPLEKIFRHKFWAFNGEFNAREALAEILKNLNLSKVREDKYRGKTKNWLGQKQSPDWAEVLEIMDLVPSMLINFLSTFVDCSQIPSLQSRYQHYNICMELVYQDPLCIFVNAALQIQEYKELEEHSDELLAFHATCSVDHLRRLLVSMLMYNIVTFDGKKFYPSSFDFSFSGTRHEKLRGLTKCVTDLSAERYTLAPALPPRPGTERNASVSSVRVNAMSQQAANEVQSLVSEFHHKVMQIIKEDEQRPKNNVQLIVLHSFSSIVNKKI